ncbi:TPA: hypothetical protein ACSPJ7_005601 [Bacillus cereus]
MNLLIFLLWVAIPARLIEALPTTITAALCDTFLIILAVFELSVIVLQFQWLRLSKMIVEILFSL